ncbi:bifunctional demethylmenaquinone methyltransferase/2-methoxy-6-polyprenyl-1,4-benzoquinol methylase UbiE [Chamaesiphon polymorphus]|uniref:2-phytyl-1,4-naphtoquinone methyltransferase n=1 Tax=Chamaesiphon polymorphus CCALA 037 TaxID=2107692 RepID=A0A2T1G1V5_9CYAN|nr:bifunctional demethylmenaquinone methyltransferase/2-methoxy-6-polyprenyl-1,4-benzoquinol methylase UbiE [Chamaesiphon polymorphus]PSB51146.1 bifunctional demethylmenaquinone methyltransferase/2-methoxy-6-polyprenyl-1,4-benzoquinol methylase UbiE [Chamaesiphon polymorphus CCALA 037]
MTDRSNYTSTDIQAIFNRIAPVYDRLNNDLSLGIHWVWKQMTVSWSAAKAGDTCLDLCCGSGDITQLLAKRVGKTGIVIGADFAPAQLTIAAERIASVYPPLEQIQWVEADALNLPFADNYFDAATMGYGLRNVTDIPRSLAELYRVLKPDAKVAILDFHRPSNGLVRRFQQWYLDEIVVPKADRLGMIEEYAYLNPSLDRFPIGSEQVKLGLAAGFSRATHYPIASGMMGVLVLTK